VGASGLHPSAAGIHAERSHLLRDTVVAGDLVIRVAAISRRQQKSPGQQHAAS